MLNSIGRAALLLAFLWAALGTAKAETYSFGVLSQRSAVLTAQFWNPIFEYVRQRTGVELVLRASRTAPESNEATERGDYDFVYSNTIFQPRMLVVGYQVILRPRDGAITGQIVTLENSPVRSLLDLMGQEVGFPSRAAFVGYAVPMDQLMRQGVNVVPVFGGNQEGIMGQLKVGKVAAAGVNNLVMKAFAHRENLRYRVLWESVPYNNIPIAVHPRVPHKVLESVRSAIDGMENDPDGMRVLEATAKIIGQTPPYGFQAATSEDYRNYLEFYRKTLLRDFK
ncbi:MAG: phosphate/phosphite/phosphonate ABC transporter substrate-binding protein [Rhodocyclales bacterium]|nr:phosphate/phosphite/phosphonate ABC transporter substrate-binding protein [Rhodocyclales bacterium]